MIKEDEIGKEYTVTFNGLVFTTTISQDPSQYKFYRTLGLDVFDLKKEITDKLDELGVSYRSNSKIETLQKKLYDFTNESAS